MSSRPRRRSRRRTTGAGLRNLLSPGASGLVALTSLARRSNGPGSSLLRAGRTSRRRSLSTSTSRSRSRRRYSASLFRSPSRSLISVVPPMSYSSGLESLLPPGFRKFFFLGATPTRSMTLGSSSSELFLATANWQGSGNMPTWTPPPGAPSIGPRIPSTPSRETSA